MEQDQFSEIIKSKCFLSENQIVIAGISGGPDSLCLLHLLYQAGMQVIAVHLNHQLREEAQEEANLVFTFCKQRGITCLIEQLDVRKYASGYHFSVEEAARFLRYQFLFDVAKKYDAQAVMVAHNANDQAETVLMHLLRGTGLSGLKGMQIRSYNPQWSTSIPLVRPLLFTTRAEILTYCENNGLSPSFDKSNEDTRYFRNRIRHELLPLMTTYNPQILEGILKMSDVINSEDDFINTSTESAWNESILRKESSFIVFSDEKLKKMHPAILRRVLRRAIQTRNTDLRDIDYEVIDRAKRFLETPGHANHLSLIDNVEILKYQKKQIIVCNQNDLLDDLWPQIHSCEQTQINFLGKTTINEQWVIQSERLDHVPPVPVDLESCILDADGIDRLELASFQPGDRFTPFGFGGKSIKLGDYWTNKGLPERARKHWPLIKNSTEIVWIPGFQISEKYKVTGETRHVLAMKLIHQKSD